MKKIILPLCILFSLHSFSQNAAPDTVFVFNANGLTDFIVKKVPNKTKEELYRRTLEWINTNTKKPKDVIVSQAEGDKIKSRPSAGIRCGSRKNCRTKIKTIQNGHDHAMPPK